jgi:hypothetical protein
MQHLDLMRPGPAETGANLQQAPGFVVTTMFAPVLRTCPIFRT